jgi:hypothetical protein
MHFSLFCHTVTILRLISLAHAAPDQATTTTCKEIETALAGSVAYPKQKPYKDEINNFWSQQLIDTIPACIVLAETSQAVSTVVKILNKNPTVKFAIKSGGHDPNPGHSNIQDGVLLSLTKMKGAKYDAGKNVAYVGPGGHWNDVIGDLAASNVTVVGGRLGK